MAGPKPRPDPWKRRRNWQKRQPGWIRPFRKSILSAGRSPFSGAGMGRPLKPASERALRVDPNYADDYALSAWILNYAGRTDGALAAMEKAMGLNPRPTASYLEVLGEIRFAQRRYGESVSLFERVLEINPNHMRARMWIAVALALTDDRERSEWETIELMV